MSDADDELLHDVKSLCRLCLVPANEFIDLKLNYESANDVKVMINHLFSFWVLSEDSTTLICDKCVDLIRKYYLFHNTVVENQRKLIRTKLEDTIQDLKCDNLDIYSVESNDGSNNIDLDKFDVNLNDEGPNLTETLNIDSPLSHNSAGYNLNDEYPKEIIKNGKFIIKRSVLENIASKFFNLECNTCDKPCKFEKLSEMLKHYSADHDEKGYVTCCESRIYRRDLIYMHLAKHLQPSAFECPICKKKVTRLHTMKIHLETHLPEIERSYKCDQCDRSYINSSGLNYHKLTNHIPVEERPTYECNLCNKTFNSSSSHSTHISIVHSSPKYLCAECGKNFQIKKNYLEHLQVHDKNGEHRIQCQFCGFVCKNKGSFRYHMKIHSTVRFKCIQCDYTTHRKTFLNQHVRIRHTDVKPYTCDLCGKAFKLKSGLKTHMPQHTGECKFTCVYCQKKFTASSNYYTHLKKMHSEKQKENLNKRSANNFLCVEDLDVDRKNTFVEDLARTKIKELLEGERRKTG